MQNNKGKGKESVGFAYKEVSKKGEPYIKVTIDLTKLTQSGDTVKLVGFVVPQDQIDEGKARGKSIPNIRFIESLPQASGASTATNKATAKSANKSELPF